MNNLWHVIVLFFASKQWMPIAIIAIAYLVRLTSDQSKFPVFVAARWRPMIVIALAQVYAILAAVQAGTTWQDAGLHGLETAVWTMGLFDVLVNAIWNGKEPPWLAFLLGFVKGEVPRPPPANDVVKCSTCRKCSVTWAAPPNACPKCGETPTKPELGTAA